MHHREDDDICRKIVIELNKVGIGTDIKNGQIFYNGECLLDLKCYALYLLRHAETYGTKNNKFMSNQSSNSKLTDMGIQTFIMYGQLPSEKAIANLIGAEFQYTKALELQLDEQYLRQMAKILIQGCYDVKYIHLKGPDEPGHDHEPWRKVEAIESIDRFFMQ